MFQSTDGADEVPPMPLPLLSHPDSPTTPSVSQDACPRDVLLDLSERQMRKIRGDKLAIIFQDPMTSLNPIYKVGRQIAEAHLVRADPERRVNNDPHEMSGGMRQRAMIVMVSIVREF